MREAVLDFTQRIPLLIVDGEKTSNLGYRGEHNATQLTVIPPKEFENNESIISYRVCFGGECSGYETSSFYKAVSGNNITFPLPIDVTSNPVVSIQLEGWGEENILIVKTPVYRGATFGYTVSTNDVWADDPKVYDSLTNMDCGIIALDLDSAGYATNVLVYGDFAGGFDFTINNRIERVTLIGCNIIPDEMFASCVNLRDVFIADTTTSIGKKAFYNCTALRSVRLPQSVKYIGDSAFEGCSALYEINIPTALTDIGNRVFAYCGALSRIYIPSSVLTIGTGAFQNSGLSGAINIPDSVYSIGNYAFSYCDNITSVVIPNSVTSIGFASFQSCESLNSVELSESITSIPDYLFQNCSSLGMIKIPESVTSIGSYAFRYCSNINNITLPPDLEVIGQNAFSGCNLIKDFELPDTVTTIGSGAFERCSSITTFTFPELIKTINSTILMGCSGLTSVIIDKNVESIGALAFSECANLSSVYIRSAAPPTIHQNNPFPYTNGKLKIYVPSSDESLILKQYKAKTNWNTIESYDSNIITEWGDYISEINADSMALSNEDIDALTNE